MRNKFVFYATLLSVFSCQNRYLSWSEFYTLIENTPKIVNLNTMFSEEQKAIYSHHCHIIDTNHYNDPKLQNYITSSTLFKKDLFYECISALSTIDFDHNGYTFLDMEILLLRANALLQTGQYDALTIAYEQGMENCKTISEPLKTYIEARWLHIKANSQSRQEFNIEALATIHYALHRLSKIDIKYQVASNELLKLKLAIFLDDEAKYKHVTSNLYMHLYHTLLTFGDLDGIVSITNKYASALINGNQIFEADSTINTVNKELVDCSNKTLIEYYLTKVYINLATEIPLPADSIIAMIHQANKLITDTLCNKIYYVTQLYEADVLISEKRFVEAIPLIFSEPIPDICDLRLRTLIQYYKNQIIAKLYKDYSKFENLSVNQKIEPLIHNRQAAPFLFPGDQEFHLGDFFVENTQEILEILTDGFRRDVNLSFHELVLSLFNDSKYRELKRIGHASLENSVNGLDALQSFINDDLRRCADFSNSNDFDSVYYQRLYVNFGKKALILSNKKSLTSLAILDTLQKSKLDRSLISQNAVMLDILKTSDIYLLLQYDGLSLKLDTLHITPTDIILQKNIKYISSYDDGVTLDKKSLTSKLKSISFSDERKYYINPDGYFAQIPFDVFFPNHVIVNSYKQIYEAEPKRLFGNNAALLSFSDSTTRKSMHHKVISDLYHDFEECQVVKTIISTKSLPHLHGRSATFENLKAFKNKDIWHIATHAQDDTINRLGSFIYLRRANGQPIKTYTSAILELENTPPYVCLSACSSGRGAYLYGQGVFAVSRAFFKNGTETIVKTLWPVDDKFSKLFMEKFYGYWKLGYNVSDALFYSKSYFKGSKKYYQPYYWAAYVIEGNGELCLE